MEFSGYVRFLLALIFVLGLIGLLAAVAKKYGLGIGGPIVRKPGERRLKVVEIKQLDPKRKAVLISRDGVEHLVILGPNSETVVEANITPPTHADFKAAMDEATHDHTPKTGPTA